MPRAWGRSGDALLDPWCGGRLVLPGKPWSLLCRSADPESCLPASPLAGREDFKPRMRSHQGTGYKSNYRPVVSYQPNPDALDNPAMGYSRSNPSSPPALPGLSPQGHRTSSDQLQAPRMGSGVLGDSGPGPQPGAQRQADSRGCCGRSEGGGSLQGTRRGGPGGNSSCSCPTLRAQVCNNFQTVTSQSYRPLEVPDGKYPLPWNMHQTHPGSSREKARAVTPTREVSAGPGPGQRGTLAWGGGRARGWTG